MLDEHGRLIGGAAFCESRCQPRLRELGAALGKRFDKGTCFFDKAAGPGGCVKPCPKVRPENERVWELWESTWEAGNFRGMDGDPVGRHFADVESAARALGVPWNRRTFTKFKVVLSIWLTKVHEEIDRRNEGRKKKTNG